MQVAVGAAPRPGRADAFCAALLLLAGAMLCMQTFASGKWGARPSTEDEFVYLFQAKTLASGHLTYPSPPLPEFFEAAHILVTPRFAAKYLPRVMRTKALTISRCVSKCPNLGCG